MLDFLISPAFAQQAPPQGSALLQFLPLLALLVLFYFMLIRPQMKRSREHKDMLGKLAKGDEVAKALAAGQISANASGLEKQQWVVRLPDEVTQLKTAEALKRDLGPGYVVALNLASKTPAWLLAIGAKPMALGLDLRGGVHFLLEVDIEDVRTKAVTRYLTDLPAFLRKQDIRYSARRQSGDAVVLEFAEADRLEAGRKAIGKEYPELALLTLENATIPTLEVRISEAEGKRIVDFAVKQNLTTLRNRVNQPGVAEPLVQRQGADRIVVQLPGVQDTTRVKDLLGAT
ncbi:MAG: preprotein translocase subunit YajC, partial [Hydrocarboniphaga effusa]|nr:preprotein translocase subunit YajC [Hydrocarboniphaga effusa]